MSKPEPSVEEIAEWITIEVAELCGCAWELCTTTRNATKAAIANALRARDVRAVRIIQEHQDSDICKDNCWTTIKDAIREGKGD